MIGRKGRFWGGSEKQSALELTWRQAADCSRGGFQPPETHDRRRWTAVYVGSQAAKMMTTEDGGVWNRKRELRNDVYYETLLNGEWRAKHIVEWCYVINEVPGVTEDDEGCWDINRNEIPCKRATHQTCKRRTRSSANVDRTARHYWSRSRSQEPKR